MVEMERLGYTNNFEVLDAREFGLPQARERVFTVSVLNGEKFEFDDLIRTPMRTLQEFLEDDASVPDVYDVTQPSVLACIGEKGIRRATVIKDCAYTITTRQHSKTKDSFSDITTQLMRSKCSIWKNRGATVGIESTVC